MNENYYFHFAHFVCGWNLSKNDLFKDSKFAKPYIYLLVFMTNSLRECIRSSISNPMTQQYVTTAYRRFEGSLTEVCLLSIHLSMAFWEPGPFKN